MKRTAWLILLLAITSIMFAATGTVTLSQVRTAAQLLNNDHSGITVQYSVGTIEYQTVNTTSGNYTDLSVEGYTSTNNVGLPKLPLMRKIIRVPLNATITPSIASSTETDISLTGNGINDKIMPYQQSVAKNVDPATIPLAINNDFYYGSNWTTEPAVKVEELGMMRGSRLVALDFTPVQYNPSTAQLRIITSASVDVTFNGADWNATEDLYNRYYSPVFESNLAQSVFNYTTQRTSLERYPLGMIIITPQNYVATLQPFIDWKRIQGYNVTVATPDITGTTATAIKAYLQNIWNSATTQNPAPSYLLIVGDTPQVPANTGNTDSGHVTDLTYVRLQGSDYLPEMYYGRFSAINTTQVQTYVDKTLQYEMFTMPDPTYLSDTVLIAGQDATYGHSHGDGQINYGKTNYFGDITTSPNGYGPYQIKNHMYPYSISGSAESAIIGNINAGLSFINYTAHGSETSWYDPSLTVSNINALTNANKYFVSVGNCCLTNAFDTGECFGEAFTRTANKGAVAYIGGTNSTYWDEDYYWAVGHKPPVTYAGSPYIANRIGAYDAEFHYHDEAFADWGGTLGRITFMGNMAVVASNSSLANYYWEIYSIMGDPSLTPYMGLPTPITAQFAPAIQMGVGTMQVTTEPFTYVALSKDNVLYAAGLSDASGMVILNFTPFNSPGQAKLVFSRSLRQPLIATLEITSSQGPYLVVNSMTVNDGNNSIAESGETMYLDAILNNVGTSAAQSITATLSCESPYVNIINATGNISSLQPNTTSTLSNTFRVSILSTVPDQQVINFVLTMADNDGNTWNATKSITVNAPNVVIGAPTFFDPNNNGSYEPGETISITFNLTNTGHMNAGAGFLEAVINSDNASVTQNTFTLPGFNMGTNIPITFGVTIAQGTQSGTVIPIGLALTAGSQLVNGMVSLGVGATSEGFETGVIPANFTNTSSTPWTILTSAASAHAGTYCAKSGAITHNGSTTLSVTLNVALSGEISFWKKVSSESGYDYLKFYIDSTETGSWSGTVAWSQQTYPVTAGNHVFKWTYSKDYSTSAGSDCAWIDDIVFPGQGVTNSNIFYCPITQLNFADIPVNVTATKDFLIRNLGTSELTGTITVPAIVDLLDSGNLVSDTYNYVVPANSNKIFTVQVLVNTTVNINDTIIITSNDTDCPTHNISLHMNSVGANDPEIIPAVTKLEGNYPNPFNPVTSIRFSTKERGNVSICIYNSKGQLVRTLISEDKKAGNHSILWNGTDDNGKHVTSGLYLYKMQTKGYSSTKKMMLMK